jgi:hypothetical protein
MTEPEEICAAIEAIDSERVLSSEQLLLALQVSKRVIRYFATNHVRKNCVCCVCNGKRMVNKLEAMGV